MRERMNGGMNEGTKKRTRPLTLQALLLFLLHSVRAATWALPHSMLLLEKLTAFVAGPQGLRLEPIPPLPSTSCLIRALQRSAQSLQRRMHRGAHRGLRPGSTPRWLRHCFDLGTEKRFNQRRNLGGA